MKKKISNSEELNKYYKLINTKLKKYSDMNIPDSKIAKYLKPGSENFKSFINNDEELKDVDGIETILKDIIEDTYAIYKDKISKKKIVETYSSFLLESSIIDLNLNIDDKHNHEKALADIYKISISYIEELNPKIHLYSVNDHGIYHKVMILTL